jgi:hypothetical protein
LARSHYSFQKRKREQDQKKKAEDKARRRGARRASKQFDPIPIESSRPVAPIAIDPQDVDRVRDSSFTVTAAAVAHIAEHLEEARGEDDFDILLRVEQQPTGQLEVVAGQRLRNDSTFTQGPTPVLAIDRALAVGLDGRTLDVAPDSGSLKLVLR